MNFKNVKLFSFFLFIFVSSGTFAQYKYDIGIKASTYDMERFQIEQRFHLDSPYSIVLTLATGSRNNGVYSQTQLYNDSLMDVSNNNYYRSNKALKVGVQRKLGFLATDVFYAGATIGMGFEQHKDRAHTATYVVLDSMDGFPFLYGENSEQISSSSDLTNSTAINAQLGLSFGMDVPISKRFSINAEVSFTGILSQSVDFPRTYIDLQGTFSGGIRYQFGKRGE